MTTPYTDAGKSWVDTPSTTTPVFAQEVKEWDSARRGFLGTGYSVCASRTTTADFLNANNALVALTAGTSRFCKIRHEIAFGSRTVKLVYGNWYTSASGTTEVNGPTNITIRAAVEYGGTRYPVVFDTGNSRTSSSIVLAPGGWAIGTCILSTETVPGQPLWTLTLATPDGARTMPPSGVTINTWDFAYDMTTPTPGAAGDPITNGAGAPAIGNVNGVVGFWPMAVLGPGTTGTIMVVGDSIVAGAGDFAFDQNSGYAGDNGGYVARALIGTRFWRAAMFGDNFAAHKLSMGKRLAIAASCDKMIISMGTNDIVAGTALATIQQNMIDTWFRYADQVRDIVIVTIPPRTTAVGSNWGTGAQTGSTGNGAASVFVSIRAWMLDGCPIAVTYNGDGSVVTYAAAAVGTLFGNILRCKVYQSPGAQASSPLHPLTAVVDAMTYILAADGWSWRANTTETTTSDGIHPSSFAHTPMSRIIRNALPALDSTEDPPPPVGAGALPFPWYGWTYDLANSDTGTVMTLTAGTVYLFEVDVRAGTIATVDMITTTAVAATLTGAWVGIYDKYRNRLAISADVQTTFEGTAGLLSIPMVVPITVPSGRIYVGVVGITTAITIRAQAALPTTFFGTGRGAVPYRSATADTGRTTGTNLPTAASGTQVALTQLPWVAVR